MNQMPNIPFGELFYGYKMDKDGMHTGKSFPKTDSAQLQEWISNWIETTYELRVVDTLDRMVMQIVEGRMLFPAGDPAKGTLVWDKEKKAWGIEPINELAALMASVRQSRGPGGRFMHCVTCKKPFTEDNVKSALGWKETQISGMCELCFDAMFDGDDEGEGL